jgi:hypothetical protein
MLIRAMPVQIAAKVASYPVDVSAALAPEGRKDEIVDKRANL